jgi:drug/metabolite transporter (DMT)-like permease
MQELAARAGAPLRLGATEWGLIALQSMLWGSSYFFVAVAQPELAAFTIAACARCPRPPLADRPAARLPAARDARGMAAFHRLRRVQQHAAFLLVVPGQSRATGGMAAILNAAAPLFGIVLAHLFTHDAKLSWTRGGGVLVGIVGVGILVGYDAVAGQAADLMARPALPAAPFCYVLANIFVRRRLGHYPPFVIAVMQMVGNMFVLRLGRP